MAHPENASFRTVRLLNAAFQKSVARLAGGVEALLALGFVEKESLEEAEEITYVMEEPSIDDEYEQWASWYDGVKAHRDALLERMDALGVRPLPAATKGLGWDEAAPQAPRAQLEGPITLHGQRGGGI